MRFLIGVDEASPSEQVPDTAGRGVQHVALDAGNADVVNEPAPESVATTVNEEQPAARFEDTVHLCDGTVLVRVVVETVGARHHVKGG